jgi:hypothetical protein
MAQKASNDAMMVACSMEEILVQFITKQAGTWKEERDLHMSLNSWLIANNSMFDEDVWTHGEDPKSKGETNKIWGIYMT